MVSRSLSNHSALHRRLINPVNNLRRIEISLILHLLGRGIKMIMSSIPLAPSIPTKTMCMLHPQCQPGIMRMKSTQTNQRGFHLIKLQPLLHLILMQRLFAEIRHHVQHCFPLPNEENAPEADGTIAVFSLQDGLDGGGEVFFAGSGLCDDL